VRQMAEHPARAAAAKLIHALGLERPVFMSDENQGPRTWTILSALPPEVSFASALAGWALDMGLDPYLGEQMVDELVRSWRQALVLSNEDRDMLRAILKTLPAL